MLIISLYHHTGKKAKQKRPGGSGFVQEDGKVFKRGGKQTAKKAKQGAGEGRFFPGGERGKCFPDLFPGGPV
jgi:hypothetical protein